MSIIFAVVLGLFILIGVAGRLVDNMDDSGDGTAVPAFQLQNSNLNNRCKDVFSSLDALEQKHHKFERSRAREDAESDRNLIHQGPSSEDMETVQKRETFKRPSLAGRDYQESRKGGHHGQERGGQHQQFRKPMPVPGRGRGTYRGRYGRGRAMPDYKLHPERWTEYSLEDVDVSDSSSKRGALDFLHERRARRENEMKEEAMDLDSSACSKGLLTFKQPSKHDGAAVKASTKTKSKSEMNFERMDDDDGNNQGELGDNRLKYNNDLEDNGLKRKIENIEIRDEQEPDSEKTTTFKNRKRIKRNFRLQRDDDDEKDCAE